VVRNTSIEVDTNMNSRIPKRSTEPGSPLADDPTGAAFLEAARPRLLGLAYRILGSRADAEDVVQDTFLRWHATDRALIDSPGAWLTTVCTRRAVDVLRAAYRSRFDYVGNWLPEPVQTTFEPEAEARMELASSLSTAFLLMLERLAPKERAAYLLHEIFELSYSDIAASLDIKEAACRKLVSRARSRIATAEPRFSPPREQQQELLAAFQDAVQSGQPGRLMHLLAGNVHLTADGGGKVPTAGEIIDADAVIAFLTDRLAGWWASYDWQVYTLNDAMGYLLRDAGQVVATVSFAYDASGLVTDIFIMRNPDKLQGLDATSIH
jgi:RNA polymerase sigma factor (sigma-70 family)